MTLAGSPALDLAIASLTGRGRASAADSKIFKNSLGSSLLQKITYLLPTSTSHPLPTYPIPPRPLRECGPVHFLAKKPLSASRGRGAVDIRSSSSSRQHPSGVACSHLFFFPVIAAAARSCPPRLSVRPSSQSARPSTHQICLPAWPNSRFRFVRLLSARLNIPTNDACCLRRILIRAVGRRLSSIVGLEILCPVPGLPRAPRPARSNRT